MLSDVTVSIGSQSVTFPGLYLLIGCLIILGLVGFVVAMTSSRRIERKTSEATDILVVQLERIGDALDRLVAQSAAKAPAEAVPTRQRDRFLTDWAIPGRGTPPAPASPRAASTDNGARDRTTQRTDPEQPQSAGVPQAVALAKDQREETQPNEQPVESNLSEPARSILFSMLGR